MEPAEYANLEAVEAEHWYYAGKRDVVRYWIHRATRLRADQTLLDCGAGTGRFAKEMEAQCRVLVLDDHDESLRMLRTRFGPEQILTLENGTIPLPDAAVDVVTALDVLEHVPDDAAAVRGFHRVLKPNGLAVITVPASRALWSDWDEALHHHRRYDRAQLRALFGPDTWDIVHVNYTNVVIYPVVWIVRKWRSRRRGRVSSSLSRTEDTVPPPWLNRTLRALFVGMARSRVPFPFGVSLVLVARKRG